MSLSLSPGERYLLYLDKIRKVSEHTLKAYRGDLLLWETYLRGLEVSAEEADRLRARDFLCVLYEEKKMAGSSVRRILSTLKGFYDFGIKEKLFSENPFLRIKPPKKEEKLPQFLTYEDFEKLTKMTEDHFAGLRDRLLFECLISSGCRVSELVRIDLTEELNRKRIKIQGKGRKDRYLYLSDQFTDLLERYKPKREAFLRERRKTSEALFLNKNGDRLGVRGVFFIVRSYGRKLEKKKTVSPHVFRHSFATWMLNEGSDIRFIQEFLGHASLSSTQIYTHTGIERLKSVYRTAHPHGTAAKLKNRERSGSE